MTIYCYWDKPNIVVAGLVDVSTDLTFPMKSISISGISSGSAANVKVGQTVLIGSLPGWSDLGRARVKSAPSGGTIPIGWCEQGIHDGEIDPSVGSYVTVLNEYRLWAKIARIDPGGSAQLIWMDGDILPGSYATNAPPVANIGPHEAGTIN